jgi:small-conductance mechanosensitive channel
MSIKSLITAWLALSIALFALAAPALAQTPVGDAAATSAPPPVDTSPRVTPDATLTVPEDRWDRVFLSAESYVAGGEAVETQSKLYQELLDDILVSAAALRQQATAAIGQQEALIDALGPAPDAEKNETEPKEVADQRREYQAQLDALKSGIARAEVAVVRSEALKTSIAGLAREQLATQLNQRTTDP